MAERYDITLERSLLTFHPKADPELYQLFLEFGPALLALRYVGDFARYGKAANPSQETALRKAGELADAFFTELDDGEVEPSDDDLQNSLHSFVEELNRCVTNSLSQFDDSRIMELRKSFEKRVLLKATEFKLDAASLRDSKNAGGVLETLEDDLKLLIYRLEELLEPRQNETVGDKTKLYYLKTKLDEFERELVALKKQSAGQRATGGERALLKRFSAALSALAEYAPRFDAFHAPTRLEPTQTRFHDVARLIGALATYRGEESRPAIAGAFEHAIRVILDPDADVYTPNELSELLAEIVAPQQGETVYDPTAGVGGTLLRAARLVPNGDVAIRGQEWNAFVAALANVNLLLHGFNDVRLWDGDVVTQPGNVEKETLTSFDAIVADLPIMSRAELRGAVELSADKFDHYGRFDEKNPVSPGSEYAFFQHMLASLNSERGRMAVVTVGSALARSGAEGRLRARFIEENLLDAIIALPQRLGPSFRSPRRLVVFKKNRANNDVLFIDASKDYVVDRPFNRFRREDVNRILDVYRQRLEIPGYSRRVGIEELRRNEFNLSLPRYIEPPRPLVDLDAMRLSISRLESKLDDAGKKMKALLKDWE
ncbi:MAG: N-6 DNA methylase [Thermoguttaceae bacterium]|nr:N-6 DNA methylase [Thermoguttaceae bacterium]